MTLPWGSAFSVALTRLTRRRSRRSPRNSIRNRSPRRTSRKGDLVRRPRGQRVAYRGDHDEVTGGVGLAAERRDYRKRRRDQLAEADAPGGHAERIKRNRRGYSLALAPRSRSDPRAQRDAQSAW